MTSYRNTVEFVAINCPKVRIGLSPYIPVLNTPVTFALLWNLGLRV